jgi:hypothetical protein
MEIKRKKSRPFLIFMLRTYQIVIYKLRWFHP